jgi:hypothetical protein
VGLAGAVGTGIVPPTKLVDYFDDPAGWEDVEASVAILELPVLPAGGVLRVPNRHSAHAIDGISRASGNWLNSKVRSGASTGALNVRLGCQLKASGTGHSRAFLRLGRPNPKEPGHASVTSSGDVQYSAPMPSDVIARTLVEPPTDLAVEPIALPLLHDDVTGERLEQLDVPLRVIGLLPVVVAHLDGIEETTRLDLGSLFLQFARTRPSLFRGPPFPDLVVDLLDLDEEGVTRFGEYWTAFQNARCPPGRRASHALR